MTQLKHRQRRITQGSAQALKVGSRLRLVTQKRNLGRLPVTLGYKRTVSRFLDPVPG